MEKQSPPKKIANITYDKNYINVDSVRFHQTLIDYDTETFYTKLLLGDDESVHDAEKIFIWTMIHKYLVQQKYTHVNDSENNSIVEVDEYLADIKAFIAEMTI